MIPVTKLDIKGYQPKESKPGKFKRQTLGGVALYFKESIQYYPTEIETNIECSFFRVIFENKKSETFCLITGLNHLNWIKFL